MEEEGRRQDETQHLVTISNWYYLGVYEVTQDQFEKVMGYNPSDFKGAKHPVESVNFEDAISFCNNLSELPEEKAANREYRLPTEAEWEYSCRAGSISVYSCGDKVKPLMDYAWFSKNSAGKSHPVGEKKPNRWGLYDMHGNVWEFCQDYAGNYPADAATDPKGPNEGYIRVYRGGSWTFYADVCRSAHRSGRNPSTRMASYGFRIALTPPGKQPASATRE